MINVSLEEGGTVRFLHKSVGFTWLCACMILINALRMVKLVWCHMQFLPSMPQNELVMIVDTIVGVKVLDF